MTTDELLKEVWELIDNNTMKMSQKEYLDFLEELAGDASIRADGVREEMENDNE